MRRRRKGIVGIEAAIILIAFVIVAAALAFVALNMGLFTSQKSKEVMARGLEQASSSAEIDGSVTVYTSDGSKVSLLSIPIKLSPGREAIDLNESKSAIRLILPGGAYENINQGVYYWNGTHIVSASDPNTAVAVNALNITELANALWATAPANPEAYVVFLRTVNSDTVLEFGEKAIIIVNLPTGLSLSPYDTFNLELRPPEGAPLTVERMIPPTLPVNGGTVDLG